MRRSILVLLLVVPLLVVEPAGAHFGTVPADPAAKKCKKGKVRVKVGKRRRCVALRKAFPKPKAGDPRKLFTQGVLRRDLSRLRNRRGKHIPSLPKLIRKAGPRAPALLTRATSRGLTRLDAMAVSATGASLRAQAAAGCDNLRQAPRQRDNFTQRSGGTSATVGVSLGPDGASMGIELTGNEFSVSVDIDMGLCDPNEVEAPSCPTAVGRLQGKIRYKFKVAISVSRGSEDVWSQASEVTRRTTLDGFNEVDAKLDGLDIDDVETSNFRLGGSSREFPPMSIRTKIVRRTHVDMRSGSYDPGQSEVDATINMEGLYGPDRDDAEADFERKARTDADRQFRAVIEKSINGYKTREEGWQNPNTCARLKFSPVKSSLTLRAGASGSFTVTAIANEDGGESELDATLTQLQNARFEPTRAGGQRAQFSYRDVAPATTTGQKMGAKVRATSKAGVAEDTWEQDLEPPFLINQIAGNFSGSYTQPAVGGRTSRVTWTGAGTFKRQAPDTFPGAVGSYLLIAGQANYHFSGGDISGRPCDMRGSEFVDLFQDGSGSIGVQPVDQQRPYSRGPHDYGGEAGPGFGPMVTLTSENCDPGGEEFEGDTYEYPIPIAALDTGDAQQRSPDGIQYEGSYSQSGGGATHEWTWVLTGSFRQP